ncbi:MAG: hypothetical protein HUJ83_07615, partial [Veillonella sp.]|nr:hypothetical protein [Veillonella sp.]
GQVAIYTYTKTSAWGWTGPVYEATLSPNQSRSKTIKANATEVKFFLQPAGGSNPKKITVTTDGTSLR